MSALISESYRPSFDQIYMGLAKSLCRRASCQRLQVGVVITTTDHRQVLAVGYNGNATGLPNICEDTLAEGNCGCLHAEENAIINCNAPRSERKFVYATHSPCTMCAKRLINLGGVEIVHFINDYRDTAPLGMLERAGIRTIRLPAWYH